MLSFIGVKEREERLCIMGKILPFLGMVMVVLAQVSNMVVSKVAMSTGLSKYVLAVYCNAFSTLILLPVSFIFHRSEHPTLTFSMVCRFLFSALLGCSAQIFGYAGVEYSSPTLGTAMLNLIPAFTFILAIIFRVEELKWRSSGSQAKFVGTVVSITGAFVVTFYKGPPLMMTPSLALSSQQLLLTHSNWVLGGFFFAFEAFMTSAWYIVQALIVKKFPAWLTVMFYLCFFKTILSALFSLIVVKDPIAWRLTFDMGLVAVLYAAVVATTLRVSLCTWCLLRTGPLYVSMFKPLGIIFSIVMGVIFLRDVLCVGSLIGAIIIVTGFFSVMWGKAKEQQTAKNSEVGCLASSSQKVPLLQEKIQETQKYPV